LLKALDTHSNKKPAEIRTFEQIHPATGFLFSAVGRDGKVNLLHVIGGVEGIVFGGE
jgi:hypothetical protein